MLRSLFEGAHYNSEAWEKCAVCSRARTKQGRGVIKEIRYLMESPLLKDCTSVEVFDGESFIEGLYKC